jgi:hypothetical protein
MQNWSDANLHELHLKRLHCQRITIWYGILAFGIMGPYLFRDENGNAVTVTSDQYVNMLNEFMFPELCHHDRPCYCMVKKKME